MNPDFKTLVANAIAWARRRSDSIEEQAKSLEWLAGSGLIVPNDLKAIHAAISQLRAA